MKQSGDYVEVNCQIVETDIEDKLDAKTGNLVRTTKTKRVCDLVKGEAKPIKGKTITRETLIKIIREEADYVIQQVNNRVSVEQEAFDALMNKATKCIDYVIPDDDEEVIDEKCGDETPGNRLHKSDGTWGSKKSNTSWSLQNKGCGASQMKPNSNVRRATKLPCGRKAREKGDDVPCKGKSK
jgi:hypothetical protein